MLFANQLRATKLCLKNHYLYYRMRVLSAILIVHILFLTIAPVLPFSRVQKKECRVSCCSQKEDQKSDKDDSNGCCKYICNPFMICCKCAAVTGQVQNLTAPFTYANNKFCLLAEFSLPGFIPDAWNPPKYA
jgi:hypothetical protein